MFIVIKYINGGIIRCDGPFDTEEAADAFVNARIKESSNSRVMKFAKYEIHRLYRP